MRRSFLLSKCCSQAVNKSISKASFQTLAALCKEITFSLISWTGCANSMAFLFQNLVEDLNYAMESLVINPSWQIYNILMYLHLDQSNCLFLPSCSSLSEILLFSVLVLKNKHINISILVFSWHVVIFTKSNVKYLHDSVVFGVYINTNDASSQWKQANISLIDTS